MARGAEAILPNLEELATASSEASYAHPTGDGIRARHLYCVGLDWDCRLARLPRSRERGTPERSNSSPRCSRQSVCILNTRSQNQMSIHLSAARAVVGRAFPPYHHHEFPTRASSLTADRRARSLPAESAGAAAYDSEDVDRIRLLTPTQRVAGRRHGSFAIQGCRQTKTEGAYRRPSDSGGDGRPPTYREGADHKGLVPGRLTARAARRACGHDLRHRWRQVNPSVWTEVAQI